jgi:hypothetical protein
MNTEQINCTLYSVPWIASTYVGCFPVDKLPVVDSLPMAMIVNADPSTKPGTHWMALYFTVDRRCEFFDSLGRQPHAYGYDFNAYTTQLRCGVWQRMEQIQGALSNVCGQYCVLFIACRCHGFSVGEVSRMFSPFTREANDRLVVSFFRRLSLAYRLLQRCCTMSLVQHSIPLI